MKIGLCSLNILPCSIKSYEDGDKVNLNCVNSFTMRTIICNVETCMKSTTVSYVIRLCCNGYTDFVFPILT